MMKKLNIRNSTSKGVFPADASKLASLDRLEVESQPLFRAGQLLEQLALHSVLGESLPRGNAIGRGVTEAAAPQATSGGQRHEGLGSRTVVFPVLVVLGLDQVVVDRERNFPVVDRFLIGDALHFGRQPGIIGDRRALGELQLA